MEEEAQRLAQAMMPLIEASALTNGQPPRKLHRDNDVVRNVSETELGEHQSNGTGCSSECGGGAASEVNNRVDSPSSSHQ